MGKKFLNRGFLRNSAGIPDGMYTMAWVFCVVISVNALVGMFAGSEFIIKGDVISGTVRIPGFEWKAVAGLLTAVAGYVVRRNNSTPNTPAPEDTSSGSDEDENVGD